MNKPKITEQDARVIAKEICDLLGYKESLNNCVKTLREKGFITPTAKEESLVILNQFIDDEMTISTFNLRRLLKLVESIHEVNYEDTI